MRKRQKCGIVVFSFKKRENVQEENRGDAEARFLIFIERESAHSL